jgi:hypothetical protein
LASSYGTLCREAGNASSKTGAFLKEEIKATKKIKEIQRSGMGGRRNF